MFKVDIFIPKTRAFDQQLLARRLKSKISSSTERRAYFVTAEGLILAKLERYQQSEGTPDLPWHDMLAIIQIHDRTLDQAYLRQWADNLNNLQLHEKTLSEASK